MRNPESLFSSVVNFINNVPVGGTYASKDLCQHTRGIEEITWWKSRSNNESYRTRTYQTYLRHAGFLQNVSYGTWKVIKHIPDWFTLSDINKLLGYTHSVSDKHEVVNKLNQKPENPRAPQAGEAITSFDCIDPLQACIELRLMGILAVPVSESAIEIHAIYKDSGSDMAEWMYKNGYDIDDYPELEHIVKAYWPDQDDGDEDDCDCEKVCVVVLDFVEGKTYIYQGIKQDEVEDFIEENYNPDDIHWMTMKKLNLEIL
jgi:hypothetical protein